MFEVNEAHEVIHGVPQPDTNIICGTVVDDAMGDETLGALLDAGFDRWDEGRTRPIGGSGGAAGLGLDDDEDLGDGDEFDVPSFLR